MFGRRSGSSAAFASTARAGAAPAAAARAGAAFVGAVAVALLVCASRQAVGVDLSSDTLVQNPRAFGRFIGDKLIRRIEFTVPRPFVLVQNGLPKAERVSTWIEINSVTAKSTGTAQGSRYHIDLEYQIVNSPRRPQIVVLPDINLEFRGAGTAFEKHIDEWPIAVAPLVAAPLEVGPLASGTAQGALPTLRPAHVPRLIDTRETEALLAIYGVAALSLFAYLAYRYFGLSVFARREQPFAAAHRTIRGLAKSPATATRIRAALRAVHRAFDLTAGYRVFANRLDEFIEQHAEFADFRDLAVGFFSFSQNEFFGNRMRSEPEPLDWLVNLCARFASRERRASAWARQRA